MKPTRKEIYQKEFFFKNVDLLPIKIQRPMEKKNDINRCEGTRYYYFDDDGGVICRRCYIKFNILCDFKLHKVSCHTTLKNYKLNTYNDVYKKYKLKKSKTKKKMNNHLSSSKLMNLETLNTRKIRKRDNAAQLMDLETLNTRKTRKRCYQNTIAVVTVSKSSSDPGSINSKKATVKTLKKEDDVIYISSDENVEESNTKPNDLETLNTRGTKKSAAQLMNLENLTSSKTRKRCYQNTMAVVNVSKSSSDPGSINSKKATVKTLKKEDDVIYIISDESDVEESNTKPNGC